MPDSRADAAYQRAIAAYKEGAREAARRFAVEALAEDPKHEGARAVLRSLESNRPVPPPPVKPRAQAQPTILSSQPTMISSRPGVRSSGGADAPTILAAQPTVLRPPVDRAAPGSKAREPQWKRYGPQWKRYRRPVLIAGLIVVAAGVVMAVIRLGGWLGAPGQMLTIRKSAGGTIVGNGIKCGTLGSECSASLSKDETIELDVLVDAGYVFGGYTGDCAPVGRTTMTRPRTCGATFALVPTAGPPAAGHVLTVTAPKGGTILSAGITCGTLGSECSTNVPDGQQVVLRNLSDGGYTFVRYTGDCAPGGQTLMKGPITCGAEFATTAAAEQRASGPPPLSSGATRRPSGRSSAARSAPEVFLPPPPAEPGPASPAPGSPGSSASIPGPLGPTTFPAPPPIPADVTARKLIQTTLEDYCSAHERLDPEGVLRVYRAASLANLRNQFRQFKSVKCMLTGPPEFVRLNPEAGSASVKVGVKQVFDMKVGGVQPQETIMVTTMSRPEPRGNWGIDTLKHEPKPK